jgi:hypothetical protein
LIGAPDAVPELDAAVVEPAAADDAELWVELLLELLPQAATTIARTATATAQTAFTRISSLSSLASANRLVDTLPVVS